MEIVRLHLATIGAMHSRGVDDADLTDWDGQYSDRDAWSSSLHKLHEIHPYQVHFCHDTKVVHG